MFVLGTTAVAILDGGFAAIRTAASGRSPLQPFRAVAAGLIGPTAFRGGVPAALLGIALHVAIAAAVVAVYFAASRRRPVLVRRPIACGALYGVLVYVVMYYIVIPLSLLSPGPRSLAAALPALFIHVAGVGVPAALAARARRLGGSAARRLGRAVSWATLLLVAACGEGPFGPPDRVESFSFDDGLEGWTAEGIDLMLGDEEIEWSVAYSGEHAGTRGGTVRMHMVNENDAGKIWMERRLTLEPATRYHVTLSFDFGTADYGQFNLFTILAGAFPEPPRTTDALVPAFRGHTSHGGDGPTGVVWLPKQYRFTAKTGPGGELRVVVGVWGTWESTRTYFVDDVKVELTAY
jgi:hypothetical protein